MLAFKRYFLAFPSFYHKLATGMFALQVASYTFAAKTGDSGVFSWIV